MAGLAVLGAASAVVQLIDYGFGAVWYLRDLYRKVERISKRHRELEDQFNLLIHTRERIKNNPALQSWEAKVLVEATGVEVQRLEELLCRPPFASATVSTIRRLWTAMSRDEEKRMIEDLERVSKQNAGLSTCIVAHTAEKMTTIGLGVEELKGILSANSELSRAREMQSYVSQHNVA
jgi:hypothetical protein